MLFNTILAHRAKKWKYPSQGPDGYEYAGGILCPCVHLRNTAVEFYEPFPGGKKKYV